MTIDRRRFLVASAATLALKPLTAFAQGAAPTVATLTLHPDQPGPTVPANFLGLSYEKQQLSDPSFFSPANKGLIEQFRALAPHGVLRIGGNTSDVGWWKPKPDSPQPPMNVRKVVGEPSGDLAYSFEPIAITNLHGFLEATGWTCLYGINLGTNTPALGADEAKFAAKTLGAKLEYLQLGNEPDLFDRHMRDPKTWNADAYLDEWLAMANAIRAVVPNAKFGLPDTSGNPQWSSRIAERLSSMPNAPRVASVNHHYYFGGPPSNPQVNIERLLHSDPKVASVAATTKAAAEKLHVPYRMTEGNTCYRGGKPGVSDTFAAALWAADYCLQLASLGYSGVNLHGGDGQMVANSLGGKLPGDEIVLAEHGNPAEHPHPYYTPIAHIGDKYIAEPVAKGMMFVGMFAGATMIPVELDAGRINATAYAATRADGKLVIAVLNKDTDGVIDVKIDAKHSGVVYKLTGESLNSPTVSFADPQKSSIQVAPLMDDKVRMVVRPSSAVLYVIG